MMNSDARNVTDDLKGVAHDEIIQRLDKRGVSLEIAIENVTRDYNMGTIVRSANAFGVRTVHVIGSRQWNKRGAMKTDAYLTVRYWATVDEFMQAMSDKYVVAVDIVPEASSIVDTELPSNTVLVFGAEGPGLSTDILQQAVATVCIPQRGSTRSINVGVAAGIAMFEWSRQNSTL